MVLHSIVGVQSYFAFFPTKQQTGGQVQDLVLDLLKEKGSQKQVLQAYRESLEPKKVKTAILESRDLDENDSNLPAAQRCVFTSDLCIVVPSHIHTLHTYIL